MSSTEPTPGRLSPLKPKALRVLRHLETEAWAHQGWWRRGVRGWRLYEEIGDSLGIRISSTLPELFARGYVNRIPVADPGRETPVYLYRISRAGVAYLGPSTTGKIPEPMLEGDDPDADSIYIPYASWLILDVLRRYASHRLGPERWGQPGWMTPTEVRARLSGALGEHLPWLLGRGLVERRQGIRAAERVRPVWFYRASAFALQVEIVDAAQLRSGASAFVQLRPRAPE